LQARFQQRLQFIAVRVVVARQTQNELESRPPRNNLLLVQNVRGSRTALRIKADVVANLCGRFSLQQTS
jgi:hypothetical protein